MFKPNTICRKTYIQIPLPYPTEQNNFYASQWRQDIWHPNGAGYQHSFELLDWYYSPWRKINKLNSILDWLSCWRNLNPSKASLTFGVPWFFRREETIKWQTKKRLLYFLSLHHFALRLSPFHGSSLTKLLASRVKKIRKQLKNECAKVLWDYFKQSS